MAETFCLNEEYAGRHAQVADREAILRCADQIAPLPQTALKVLELLDDPNRDVSQVAEAISTDAGLTAAILRLAHSPAYAQTGGMLTVMKRAIVRLADWLAHASFIGTPPGYPVDLEMVQRLANSLGLAAPSDRGVVGLIVAAKNKFQTEARYWSA